MFSRRMSLGGGQDNMLTGTAGLLEALRRRKWFDPISYA